MIDLSEICCLRIELEYSGLEDRGGSLSERFQRPSVVGKHSAPPEHGDPRFRKRIGILLVKSVTHRCTQTRERPLCLRKIAVPVVLLVRLED
ncbi:MAG: hypothetical protein DWG77_03370 [Chloroflexi bacterium]|nr:hypothetical protein [Chloroflexota bacterium]